MQYFILPKPVKMNGALCRSVRGKLPLGEFGMKLHVSPVTVRGAEAGEEMSPKVAEAYEEFANVPAGDFVVCPAMKMTAKVTRRVVDAYATVPGSDAVELFEDVLDPDFELKVVTQVQEIAGVYQGASGVRDFLSRMAAVFVRKRPNFDYRLVVRNDRSVVVGLAGGQVRDTGITASDRMSAKFWVNRNGFITRIEEEFEAEWVAELRRLNRQLRL